MKILIQQFLPIFLALNFGYKRHFPCNCKITYLKVSLMQGVQSCSLTCIFLQILFINMTIFLSLTQITIFSDCKSYTLSLFYFRITPKASKLYTAFKMKFTTHSYINYIPICFINYQAVTTGKGFGTLFLSVQQRVKVMTTSEQLVWHNAPIQPQ